MGSPLKVVRMCLVRNSLISSQTPIESMHSMGTSGRQRNSAVKRLSEGEKPEVLDFAANESVSTMTNLILYQHMNIPATEA